jgi:predicted dehydrogenase
MPENSSSRRDFLKTAAVTAALTTTATSYARVVGANQRIAVAQIGCGNRGFDAHMKGVTKHAKQENIEIVAVCDVWTPHLDRAVAGVAQWYGRPPRQTSRYEEILGMHDVDAVMIASADHQHCMHLEAAAKAKKDAYCEKPLGMNLEELKSACDAVKAAGIVVQIGTQSRSEPGVRGAKKLVASGTLGKISRCEEYHNGSQPNWYKRLSRLPIKESELDWSEFLKPRAQRPFDGLLFAGWYGYREFCSGSIGQFMSHFIDLVHFVTGAGFPSSAVAQGGTFVWKDEYHFDCPEQVETTLVYPEGFMVSYATNFGNGSGNRTVLYGTQGALDLTRHGKPAASGAGAWQPAALKGETAVEPVACPDHFLNWLQCLRSRQAPVAPIEAGYQHSIACILSDRAYQTGRRQVYDPQSRQIREG